MEIIKKQHRIGSSLTLANCLNETHDQIVKTIESLKDEKNFIPFTVKLACGEDLLIYEATNEGINKVEALYSN